MGLEANPPLSSAASSAQRGRSPAPVSAGRRGFPKPVRPGRTAPHCKICQKTSYAVQTSLSLCLCNRMHVWIRMSIRPAAQRLENRFTFHTESELLPPQSAPSAGYTKENTSPNKGAQTPASLRAQHCFVAYV